MGKDRKKNAADNWSHCFVEEFEGEVGSWIGIVSNFEVAHYFVAQVPTGEGNFAH